MQLPEKDQMFCHYDGDDWDFPSCPSDIYVYDVRSQADVSPVDTDHDGDADFVDTDSDNDETTDDADNCVTEKNREQEDLDDDGRGDACDSDRDGDGAPNDDDDCPDVANDQGVDFDGDGVGDACDLCPFDASVGPSENHDDDEYGDECDPCPYRTDEIPSPDQDEDGIGDDCEPVLTILDPHDDPRTMPNGTNEFVFSAAEPEGRLRVRASATAEMNGGEPLERYDVEWVFDDVGGVEGTVTAAIDPVAGAVRGLGAIAEWTGLPQAVTAFGSKHVQVLLLLEGQVVARAERAEYEIFWPALINPAGRWVDANFARNFPGSAGENPAPLPAYAASYTNSLGASQVHAAARRPNWFYYLSQSDAALEAAYMSNLRMVYATTDRDALGGSLARAITVAGGDRPAMGAGEWIFDSRNNEVVILPTAIDICSPFGPLCPARTNAENFHIVVRHEFEHVDEHIRWGVDRTGLPRPIFGKKVSTQEWSVWPPGNPWYSSFKDMNENDQFDDVLECDLDADQVEAEVIRESAVVQDCDGEPTAGFTVNAVPSDDMIHEMNVEALDWDGDLLPNWLDTGPDTYETLTDRPARAFATRVHANHGVRHLDWAAPGENYAQPITP